MGPTMTVHIRLQPIELRRVFGAFPTGVTAVAACVDGRPVGLAANSFTSVSLEPPIVSVCIAHTSTTWPVLRRARRLGITVLAAHQEHLGRALAAHGTDRFAGAELAVQRARRDRAGRRQRLAGVQHRAPDHRR
jgi:flavin reductase (DIM6/NTAB) family NADH-FMN oxidoreductase RutF